MRQPSQPFAHGVADRESLQERCARLGGALTGLSILFAGIAALTVGGGVWAREPLFVMSAGFALTASAAFALCAQSLARAAVDAPRAAELVKLPVKAWRRAA